MSTRRLLLSAVAGVLTLTALLAIGILLFGRFGETEGRILGTTIFLALFGLLSLPAAILLDEGRLPGLSALLFALSLAGFALATAGIWIGDPPEAFGKLTGTVIAFGLAAAQTGALAARRREDDTRLLRLLFAGSAALAFVLAALGSSAIWVGVDSQVFLRSFGAAVVLDVLLVALQPLLALVRRPQRRYVLHLRLDEAGEVDVTVEASRLSRAAARAIDDAERAGAAVVAVEVVDGRFEPTVSRHRATPPAEDGTELESKTEHTMRCAGSIAEVGSER
jgi:MFS family permease